MMPNLEDMARSAFDTAMSFGVSVNDFERVAKQAYKQGKQESAQDWISVDDRLPEIATGDELHCFLLLELQHPNNSGKNIVVDAYWANKPSNPTWGEGEEAPEWALETEDGDYLNLVGWASLTHHPDYSGYYEAFETTYRKIIAWMPIVYPSIS